MNTWVFSIALPILGHIDRSDKHASPRDLRLRGQGPPTLDRPPFVIYSEMPENGESRSFYKGGTKLSRDDLPAVEERSGQRTNWAGPEVYVAGATGIPSLTQKGRAYRSALASLFEKGGARVRLYGPVLTGM